MIWRFQIYILFREKFEFRGFTKAFKKFAKYIIAFIFAKFQYFAKQIIYLDILANKKWGPSPATLIQIYKQCVRPIFEYSSLSTITASDHIISKIQWLQNKFILLVVRLPKYILPKLLHDSTGLPYVKDRLLTCATKSLDRIAQNPLVEASISSNRLNPAWDRFSTSLSVIRPGSS